MLISYFLIADVAFEGYCFFNGEGWFREIWLCCRFEPLHENMISHGNSSLQSFVYYLKGVDLNLQVIIHNF